MFQDKVVVITGGAGGIGKCIREEFEKAGAKICIIDIADNIVVIPLATVHGSADFGVAACKAIAGIATATIHIVVAVIAVEQVIAATARNVIGKGIANDGLGLAVACGVLGHKAFLRFQYDIFHGRVIGVNCITACPRILTRAQVKGFDLRVHTVHPLIGGFHNQRMLGANAVNNIDVIAFLADQGILSAVSVHAIAGKKTGDAVIAG